MLLVVLVLVLLLLQGDLVGGALGTFPPQVVS